MITIPATDINQKTKQLFEFNELTPEAKVYAMNQLHTTKREVLNLKYYTWSGQPYIDKDRI